MKELTILRHAKSSWVDPDADDRDRPLSPRGRRAAGQMAKWLAENECHPALVLCSDAARARQTVALVHEALGSPRVRYEEELYLASGTLLLARLRRLGRRVRSVMVVGHNPGLQQLVLALMPAGETKTRHKIVTKFPTAALINLAVDVTDWADLSAKATRLIAYVTPRDLG